MAGILAGVRVLDLTRFLAGPHATLLLAGAGAEVIRVDDPHRGDSLSRSPYYYGAGGPSVDRRDDTDLGIAFLKRQRAKRSVTIDLKAERGRELLLRLVDRADVLVENFAVGVTERLGIDWPTLHARNPRLVHCAITAYGSTGPERHRRGYDLTTQAMSGLMSITGSPDGPPTKAGSALGDTIAGGFAFAGVLGALYHRERTGLGQFVDVSMVDVLFSLVFDEPLDAYRTLGVPARQGNRVPRLSPFNTYPTADGWLVVCCGDDEGWRRVCAVIGRDDLARGAWAAMSGRVADNDAVDAVIAEWSRELPTEVAVDRLVAGGAAASAVHTIDDLLAWPQLREREMIDTVQHPTLGALAGLHAAGFPLRFSGADTGYGAPATPTGADTRRVLADLAGASDAELDELSARGII